MSNGDPEESGAGNDQDTEDVASPGASVTGRTPHGEVLDVDDQVEKLRALADALAEAASEIGGRRAQGAALDDVITRVKDATATIAPYAITAGSREEGECGCGPCNCVSNACCSFDIVMTHVRVEQMQLPVGADALDSNITPFGVMEIRLFAGIDGTGVGAIIPDMFGYLSLHKLLIAPGVWSQVNRSIGTVEVPKGAPRTVSFTIDAVEYETPTERLLPVNRDEYGTATGTVTLDCCVCEVQVPAIDIQLTGGGIAGGRIAVKFTAYRRC